MMDEAYVCEHGDSGMQSGHRLRVCACVCLSVCLSVPCVNVLACGTVGHNGKIFSTKGTIWNRYETATVDRLIQLPSETYFFDYRIQPLKR